MVEYFESSAVNFIIVFTIITLIIVIADSIILIMKRKTDMKYMLPAVDSILVISGFTAFVGTGIALIQSAGKIANSKIPDDAAFSQNFQQWTMTMSPMEWDFIFKEILRVLHTALLAWFIFFVLFEVWIILRLLYRKEIKKSLISL